MELKIYSSDGRLKLTVEPRDNSTQVEGIQAGNVLSLSFILPRRVSLDVNDYANFMGHRYWLTEKYRPIQKSTVEWEYSFKLYGLENLISRFLVINSTDGGNEPVFSLTAPPREHVALIVKSINAGFGTNDWKVGTVDGGDNIVVDYHGKYCDEGLKAVADAADTEYWIEGTTVNLCRCEHGERVTLGYQNGLTKIQPDVADNAKVYTRLFPTGSSKNIDSEKYGHSRLQLPAGAQYVDINTDKYGIIHHYEENAFAGIFPRYTGTVSSVRSEERTNEEGNKYSVYYFKDDNLPFDPNQYEIGGLVKHVSFQEGSELAGLGNEDNGTHYFEANFNSDTREFEIVTQFYDSGQLPGGVLVPKAGDRYIPWNIRMPDEYYALAEAEFLDAVHEYNRRHSVDVSCFKAPTDYIEIEKRKLELHVGRRVRLESSEYFPETGYKDSRITKITRKVNLPSQMDLEISDALSTGAIDKIKGDIDEVKAYVQLSRGNLPDIIKTGDCTPFTDNNLLSARRTKTDFMSRRHDDRSAGQIASDKAFEVGNFLSGASGAKLGLDASGQTFGEMDRLFIRIKAYFETLTTINAESLAGEQRITPGGGIKCTHVVEKGLVEVVNTRPKIDEEGEPILDSDDNPVMEEYTEMVDNGVPEGVYRCYFLSEQDGEKTETKIIPGDQAISQMFNAKTGTANKISNHRYWRLVTDVSNDAYTDDSGNRYGYIDLSKSDCEVGSDTPQSDDTIVQFGNRTDHSRQAAMVFSTVASDAPSIKLFTGIGSGTTNAQHYSLSGKDIISYGYDSVKGHAYFKCYGDNYIGSPDGKTFFKYDQATEQLDIKAKFTILPSSTIDGKSLDDYFSGLIPELKQEDIEGFVNAIVDPKFDDIQDQLDGVIESFFGFGAPTLTNYPANEWTTDEARKAHAKDTYTDRTEYVDSTTTPTAGQSWKWQYTSFTDYGWVKIADSDAVKALLDAARAQDTADGKRRIFTSQPISPYDEGDLWVNATYPAGNTVKDHANGKYFNDILRCVTAKGKDAPFALSDWTLASNYTDDTIANEAIKKIKNFDYIKDAFKEATTIQRGLVLTSMVSLGVNNDDFTTQTTYSGISGLYKPEKPGGGIAAWYGGDMIDKLEYYNWDDATGRWVPKPGVSADGLRIAAGLDRMDGTGYRADGNFWWGLDGKLHADPLSFFVGENSVGNVLGLFKFNPNNTAVFADVKSVTPQRPFTSLWLGSPDGAHMIELTYDTTHNALRVKGNMYADGWLSFRGSNDGSGGSAVAGAANLSDLKDVSLGSLVAGQALVWNGAKWVNSTIATSGLNEASLSNYLSSHGYATQQWANDRYYTKTEVDAKNFIKDIGDGRSLMFNYSANALGYDNFTWVAVWNGNTLQCCNKSLFATASALTSGLAGKVNKAGDTMTGHLTMLAKDVYLKNNTDNSQYVCYGFKNTANAVIAQIGYHNTAKRVIINPVGSSEPWVDAVGKYNLIIGNNELKYNTHSLWHSGNDGHNSGLDADTVDGVQCSDILHFVALQPQNLDANSIVTTGSCYVPRGDMNNSSWNGYTFTNFPTSKPQGGFMLMNLAEGNYRRQLYTAYNNSNLYTRYYYFNGTAVTWSPWRTFAFLDSTVANANSLGGIAAGDYVTRLSNQTISGIKTFTNYTKIEQALMFKGTPDGVYFATSANGNLNISAHTNYSYVKNIGYITPSGSLTMGSFIKSGGTAAQFLKADGSVDSRAFLVLDGQQESTGPSLDLNAFNTAVFTRIRTGEQTTTNCPFAGYGQLLNLWTTGKVSALQIASKSSDIYFRSKDGASKTITSVWHRILHSDNYSSILDDRYVNASGDTMTGPLAVREIDAPDGNGLLAYSGSWTGVDFSSQYGVGTINRQGVIRSGNASLIHYRHGAGNATIWDSLNDGHGSGLEADLLDGYHVSQLARLTAANASAGAYNLPVYVNGGVVNAVSSVGEAFLSWGGQSLTGGFSPVDGAMMSHLGANRFAFLKPAGTTFQYSTNGGATWSDYGLSNTQKSGFFDAGVQQALQAGKAANGTATASHQLRITIATSAAGVYTDINKFAINFATQGCSGTTVTIEKALESTPDSWVTVASNVPLSGWTAWNVVNVPAFRTYGNVTTTQYGRIRFTFKCTGVSSDKSPFVVLCIMAYGGFGWTTPSYMAATGHLYKYDGNQNAYFPGYVRLNNDGHDVGTTWNNGAGQLGIALVNNANQTPLLVAHRYGAASDVTGANRLFALELLNNGAEMHFAFGASTKFSMTSAGVFFANGGIWTNGYMSFKGQNTSSDARQKRILRDIHVPLTIIAKAPNIVFSWLDNGKLDMGSIAQYWQKHLPLSVYVRPNGYLGMDYSKVALACVISMAPELLGVKDDVSKLKRELRQLKHENQQLKQQIDRMERRIA